MFLPTTTTTTTTTNLGYFGVFNICVLYVLSTKRFMLHQVDFLLRYLRWAGTRKMFRQSLWPKSQPNIVNGKKHDVFAVIYSRLCSPTLLTFSPMTLLSRLSITILSFSIARWIKTSYLNLSFLWLDCRTSAASAWQTSEGLTSDGGWVVATWYE